MNVLTRDVLNDVQKHAVDRLANAPVTILQVGEGNFLRGFFDWMIHHCREQGLFHGSVAVTQPRPTGKPKIEALAAQDGLYTTVIRGIEHGQAVERKDVVSVFSHVFDPYSDWERLCQLAVRPELRWVVSNTTEAGLTYKPEQLNKGPIESFPGKMAYLLYLRFLAYEGDPSKGLFFLPCELLERNGDTLKELVLRYAAEWDLPNSFREWVLSHNRFLNSLVDRIVTGYPNAEQAEAWFSTWGYRDPMLTTAEPYLLWAIEGEAELDELLPLKKAGFNVHWTNDLKSFQERKVRLLNGAHTWMTPIGIIHGVEVVRELMEHPTLGVKVRETVHQDIIPTLAYSREEMQIYAEAVFERFVNPYILHRLSDIALNSLSKFKVRVLPSIAYYADGGLPVPDRLVLGFAGLLRYYKVVSKTEGYEGVALTGKPYLVRDDAAALERMAHIWAHAAQTQQLMADTVQTILAEETFWGRDLSSWTSLIDAIAKQLSAWEA